MAESPKIRPCGVCNRQCAEETLDEHHKTPQNAGGSDYTTNLVSICQNCHQFIHRLVHLLRKGNTQKIAHFLHSNYADYPQRVHDLILDLARTAMLEENNHVRTDESIINLPLKLKLPVYTKLREMAKGSHSSMERVLIDLVEKEYRTRKFGTPPQELQGLKKLPNQ